LSLLKYALDTGFLITDNVFALPPYH